MSHNITVLSPMKARDLLVDLYKAKEPLWIHGPPGVGKSDIVAQAAKIIACNFITSPPAACQEGPDIKGIPAQLPGTNRSHYLPPVTWPDDPEWQGLYFIDELSQGQQETIAAYAMAIHARKLGDDFKLPQGMRFVIAGNRPEDRAGAGRIVTMLLDRCIHVEVAASNDDWQAWAITAGIDASVRSFLNFRPVCLFDFQPASGRLAWPTPRGWEKVSNILPHVREELQFAAISGKVGEGAAVEFNAFRTVYQSLPDIDECLKSPATCKMPDVRMEAGPATYYAMCGAVADRLRDKTAKDADLFDRYAQLAMRMPKEFGALAMRDGQAMTMESGGREKKGDDTLVGGKLDRKPNVKKFIEQNQSLWRK